MHRLVLLVILGVALIVTGFLLLVPLPWSPTVWLNLVVLNLVFLVNLAFLRVAVRGVGGFEQHVATLGFSWATRGIYTLLALGAMVTVWRLHLDFNVAALAQLTLVFGLVVRAVLMGVIRDNQTSVFASEEPARQSLDELRSLAGALQGPVGQLGATFTDAQKAFAAVQDDLRYLSAIDSAEARQLEGDLQAALAGLQATVRDARLGPQAVVTANFDRQFTEIKEIIRRRKNCRR
jgi:hypothetical protein